MEKILSFREKIDTILTIRGIKINEIEKSLNVDGTFYKAYKENREPRKDMLSEFLRKFHVKESWWKSPKGDDEASVFDKKPTPAINNSDNNDMSNPRETFYQDLIETNAAYSLIPRAVLTDYKIVPDKVIDVIIKSTEDARVALERSKDLEIESLISKHEIIIKGMENQIKRLEEEKAELIRQIPGQ